MVRGLMRRLCRRDVKCFVDRIGVCVMGGGDVGGWVAM
jgi:hypothetical protein